MVCDRDVSVQAAKSKQFPPLSLSGGYLDIVKKGYARDVESRQSSTLVLAHHGRLLTLVVVGPGRDVAGPLAR
jgi:hypothetical protein